MKKEPSRNVNIVCVCCVKDGIWQSVGVGDNEWKGRYAELGFIYTFLFTLHLFQFQPWPVMFNKGSAFFYFSSVFLLFVFSSSSFVFTKMETSLLTVVLQSIVVTFTSHSHHFFSFPFNYTLAFSSSFSCLKRPFFPSFKTFI